MTHGSHHDNAKSVVALLIVLLAFGILVLYYNNSDAILEANKFYLFMTLATVGMGLMLGLLFLVNNSKHKESKAKGTKSGKSVSKGKKRAK